MIRTGAMRHEVVIQRLAQQQDAAGQQSVEWVEVVRRRAAIQRLPGNEVWALAQKAGRVPTVFRLRFVPGILPEMRVVCAGVVYEIISAVDQTGIGEELVITAAARVEEAP